MSSTKITLQDVLDGGDRKMEVKSLRAQVVSLSPFPARAGVNRVRSQMILADATTAVRGFCYRAPNFEEGWSIKLRNFSVRDQKVLYHTRTSAIRCATSEVSETMIQRARELLVTPSQPFQNIVDVLKQEKNTRVSFRASVTQVDPVREISTSSGKKEVREIMVKDASGGIPISLWGHLSARDFCVGERVVVADALAVYSSYHQKITISINYDDEIKTNETPQESSGVLEGVLRRDNGTFLANIVIDNEEYDYDCPDVILYTLLNITEWNETEVFKQLPMKVNLRHTNTGISYMVENSEEEVLSAEVMEPQLADIDDDDVDDDVLL